MAYLYIACTAGYLLVLFNDLTQLGQVPRLLRIVTLMGYPLTFTPFVIIPIYMQPQTPQAITCILAAAACFFLALLVYSVFIEVRLPSHNMRGAAWKQGTYGFSRHPGFLWYSAMHILWMIIFFSAQAAMLLGFCIILNLGLITVEDRWIFPKLFSDYREYQQQVPFIL